MSQRNFYKRKIKPITLMKGVKKYPYSINQVSGSDNIFEDKGGASYTLAKLKMLAEKILYKTHSREERTQIKHPIFMGDDEVLEIVLDADGYFIQP